MKEIESTLDIEPSFRAEFFETLYRLESNNFWFRARNELIVWLLEKAFPNTESFLEIGCGTGFVLSGLQKANPSMKLAGSELFAEGLEFAKKRLANVDLFEIDALDLKIEKAFDVVGAFDVIEHIEEDELVLAQLYKAAKNGIILSVPQHMFLWSAMDEYACHKRRYSLAELVLKVEQAGFEILYTTSFVSLLLPLLMLSRTKNRKIDDIDSIAELKLPKVLNFSLEQIMTLERLMIRAGIRMPAGGSLLLAAKKRYHDTLTGWK